MLESMEKDINTFHLINLQISLDGEFGSEVNNELAIITPNEDISSSTVLNDAQQHKYH